MMATVTIAALSSSIAQAGFKKLAQKVADELVQAAGARFSELYESFFTDFGPHLNATLERCAFIKTILNRAEPVDLLSIYVNTSFKKDREEIDDYKLIEDLAVNRRICVTGRGGDGKTVFMKYLWLSLFNEPRGKVPVFVELRRINEFTSDDLLAYIYRSVIDVKSKITQKQFETATHQGLFVFLLDGFDEVNREKKESIERQILSLSHTHLNAVIVVSGRPDPRYDSWQMFVNYRVMPLKKKQTVDLLDKLSYEKSTKKRFVERVKKDLYDKHVSFLSSPLLATMMLLTFDQFADIPEKIYIFFDQAFDTLFLRHDATKEGFQRKRYTDLPIDRFKRYFAYFCLITYYDQKLELSETEMRIYVEKAFKANNVSVDTEAFVRDIVESICIMQKEGLNYVFTHRSFQEYFTSYCLANFIEARFDEIVSRIVGRQNDTAIAMLLDMQRDKTETNFVIPALRRNIDEAKQINCHADLNVFIEHYECTIRSERIENEDVIFQSGGNKSHDLLVMIMKLYPDYFFNDNEFKKFKILDRKLIRQLRKVNQLDHEQFITIHFDGSELLKSPKNSQVIVPLSMLANSGYAKYIPELFARFDGLLDALIKRNAAVEKNIGEILNL